MSNENVIFHLVVLLAFLILNISQSVVAQEKIKSNVELFREGIISLVDTAVKKSFLTKESSVFATVTSSDEASLIQHAIVSTLRDKGFEVYLDSIGSKAVTYSFNVSNAEMRVEYGDAFREKILGEKKNERSISVTLPLLITEKQTGKVIYSDKMEFGSKDTVATEQIPILEQETIPDTHAPLPERSFFDKLIEPLIIIGATGVAVFLFFQVRS